MPDKTEEMDWKIEQLRRAVSFIAILGTTNEDAMIKAYTQYCRAMEEDLRHYDEQGLSKDLLDFYESLKGGSHRGG